MSNPAVCFLSSTQINNIYFGIEDNLGESVHLHYGQFRISLSINEFMEFAEEIEKSVEKILLLKNLSIGNMDKESLKSEWTSNYKKIQSISECTMELDKLYMKESYVHCRRIKRIIPLRESGYIKLLKNESDDVAYYEQSGLYEPSRKEKIDAIRELIILKGYPFLDKKILVDQDGYILDGIKRASCLYYLFGGEIEVPVIKVEIQWDKSIIERIESADDEIKAFLLTEKQIDDQKRLQIGNRKYDYTDLMNSIEKTNIPFFVIKRKKETKEGYKINTEIIVDRGRLAEFREKMILKESQTNPYMNYTFLYSVKTPISFETTEGYVLVYEQICIKSKFYNQILPVENHFAQWLRKNIVFDNVYKYWTLNEHADLLMRILDCMLEKEKFLSEDKLRISKNAKFLKSREVFVLLEKEFFSYTERLLCHLQKQNYDEALREYIANVNY